MEIILLEKIKKLGNIGDVVQVKDGYARNYLLIRNKALRVTASNKAKFEAQKELIEKANIEKRKEALLDLQKIDGKTFAVVRQAGDDGRLYGSVTNRDIANILASNFDIKINVESITLHNKIKEIGFHHVSIELHADVEAKIRIIVARSQEEAKNELQKEKEASNLSKSDTAQQSSEKSEESVKTAKKAAANKKDEVEQAAEKI
ncbi:50S ribosomal protein L9 [Candidatus Bandiella euplotis]|uniref:Large ribosomal subunit protein bL9 n=1 Tax=Candidatus Bandiella euplotis TaxID=1664265 RepID=A0ABZ0UPT2_9RICK|nr:50S ribosomal protein L9 [Candidatus Bandiella woodruffii]WPX96900.1 50S ribosomal protein L9 [Candidatus Bandiella woodruffii]